MTTSSLAGPEQKPGSSGCEPVTDGRSLRATGRTVQLNLKVSLETKARFIALAQARGQLMTVLLEEAIEALEKEKRP